MTLKILEPCYRGYWLVDTVEIPDGQVPDSIDVRGKLGNGEARRFRKAVTGLDGGHYYIPADHVPRDAEKLGLPRA